MKKYIVLPLLAVLFSSVVLAQKATKQVKPKPKPIPSFSLPLMLVNADGSMGEYAIKKGDKLVYHVIAGSQEYDFIVSVNSKTDKGIDFNYTMTAPASKTGHVTISSAADESNKYVNYFSGGELKLTKASTVWLTHKNFRDMPSKQTKMSFDGEAEETFYRPDEDAVDMTVKIKGENKKIDGFKIANAQDGTFDKMLWINNISSNPLILKMELGFSITLTEIR